MDRAAHGEVTTAFDQLAVLQRAAADFERRSAAAGKGPVRMLLVDDDAQFRKLFRDFSRRFGVEITEAGTFDEAIRVAPPGSVFDFAIIDIRLKQDGAHDGIDVLRYLRENSITLPCVLFSGYLNADVQDRAQQVGGFVPSAPKPSAPGMFNFTYVFQLFCHFNLHHRIGLPKELDATSGMGL